MISLIPHSRQRVSCSPTPWLDIIIPRDPGRVPTLWGPLGTRDNNQTQETPSSGGMKLTRPRRSRSFGLLHIVEEIKILRHLNGAGVAEDEGGSEIEGEGDGEAVWFSKEKLDWILSQTVIIVPCKDEELDVIRGVISKIPACCLVILVSNSEGGPNDQYLQQVKMLRTLCRSSRRQFLAVHQKDPRAALAFRASGMTELLDPADGLIRNGKGEGMLLAIAVAAAFSPGRRRYVGFIDADNFDGNSAHEYCRAFAAGFAMCPPPEQEHSMVRLRWASKPKVRADGQLEFVPEGRCSQIVNSWLNRLFGPGRTNTTTTNNNNNNNNINNDDDDTMPLVSTGNAGEHAMTMDLALKLRMAAGYAIEPFHFADLLERGYLSVLQPGAQQRQPLNTCNHSKAPAAQPLQKPVRVLQIRTLSHHYHRPSGPDHIRRMWAAGLGAIYHNLAPYQGMPGSGPGGVSQLRRDMHQFAAEHGGVSHATGELPRPRIYPALEDADMDAFRGVMQASSLPTTLVVLGLGLNDRPVQGLSYRAGT
ncbi:hypothetical protein VTK26DRAFT_3351 [Humicola hyalothermophila]